MSKRKLKDPNPVDGPVFLAKSAKVEVVSGDERWNRFASWRQLFVIDDSWTVLGTAVDDMRKMERNMRRPYTLPEDVRWPWSTVAAACDGASAVLHPHRGLVPVFSSLCLVDVNNPQRDDPADHFQMLASVGRARGTEMSMPVTVPDVVHFRQNFKLEHCEDSLSVFKRLEPFLLSGKIFVAGGSVLRALTSNASGIATRRSRHLGEAGDIDIFLCSKDPEIAGAHCTAVFEAVTRGHDFEVVVRKGVVDIHVRPKNAQIHGWSDDTVVTVQLVLQLYESPAEVLLGFDVDSCCLGFDGAEVWALPRALRALRYGTNIVDPIRSKPGRARYEYRLVKYAFRGYSISVPGVDPTRIGVAVVAATPLDRLCGFERLVHLVLAVNNYRNGIAKCLFMASPNANFARFDWYSGWCCNEGLAAVLRASLGSHQYDLLVKGISYNPDHKSIWPRTYKELRLSSKGVVSLQQMIESVGVNIQLSWTSHSWANALQYNVSENECALDYFASMDSVILKDWAGKQYCSIGFDTSCLTVTLSTAEATVRLDLAAGGAFVVWRMVRACGGVRVNSSENMYPLVK